MKTAVRKMLAFLDYMIGQVEFWLAIGLIMVGAGFWILHPALGLIVPGAVLCWIALPMRHPFVRTPPVIEAKRSKT